MHTLQDAARENKNMRYCIIEVLPPSDRANPESKASVTVAYRDMSLSSANDARSAWNYQLSRQGGWMEVVEDSEEAIDKYTANIHQFAFKSFK